mmetsp:Transcript_37331/g.77451  ORF Transcript_37331/g.77451 Transcript_37331/m.77451 type:complete len:130 (-) Transcript_37331:252-641(-)
MDGFDKQVHTKDRPNLLWSSSFYGISEIIKSTLGCSSMQELHVHAHGQESKRGWVFSKMTAHRNCNSLASSFSVTAVAGTTPSGLSSSSSSPYPLVDPAMTDSIKVHTKPHAHKNGTCKSSWTNPNCTN